jgi:hypothetical protein
MRGIIKIVIASVQKLMICILTRRKILKIETFLKRNNHPLWKPDAETISKHKILWGDYIFSVSSRWLRVYGAISGKPDYRYIPEDVYYTEIEPRLNNKAFSKAYTDKNGYHIFLDNRLLPSVVLRSVNGVMLSEEYNDLSGIKNNLSLSLRPASGKYVIKPTMDTGGGEGVRVFSVDGGKLEVNPPITGIITFEALLKHYNRDFVIQDFIEQHSFFSQFNPGSLNTIRILTYRSVKDEKIVPLQRILRMGKEGSVVDNQASGGIACGILQSGVLSDFGVDKSGRKHFKSNNVQFSSVGKIPWIGEITDIATDVARKFRYSRLLGMDFGVGKDGKILLIEVNDSSNEINFYQMNNGPLFGDFTEEISLLCKNEPKSFLIDFNLD